MGEDFKNELNQDQPLDFLFYLICLVLLDFIYPVDLKKDTTKFLTPLENNFGNTQGNWQEIVC